MHSYNTSLLVTSDDIDAIFSYLYCFSFYVPALGSKVASCVRLYCGVSGM